MSDEPKYYSPDDPLPQSALDTWDWLQGKDDNLEDTEARLARAVALLREVGFSHLYATGEARRCRCCLTDTADGETEVHAPNCKLAALLEETDA